MAMDMRALYTIALSAVKESPTAEDDMKANEKLLKPELYNTYAEDRGA